LLNAPALAKHNGHQAIAVLVRLFEALPPAGNLLMLDASRGFGLYSIPSAAFRALAWGCVETSKARRRPGMKSIASQEPVLST